MICFNISVVCGHGQGQAELRLIGEEARLKIRYVIIKSYLTANWVCNKGNLKRNKTSINMAAGSAAMKT